MLPPPQNDGDDARDRPSLSPLDVHPPLFSPSSLSFLFLGNDAHKSKRSHAVLATSAGPAERDGRRIEIWEGGRRLEEERGKGKKKKPRTRKSEKIGRRRRRRVCPLPRRRTTTLLFPVLGSFFPLFFFFSLSLSLSFFPFFALSLSLSPAFGCRQWRQYKKFSARKILSLWREYFKPPLTRDGKTFQPSFASRFPSSSFALFSP